MTDAPPIYPARPDCYSCLVFAFFLSLFLGADPARAHPLHPCGSSLDSPGTAVAQPENLIDVMMTLWPGTRAIFAHLAAKFREGWRQAGISDHEGETILAHVMDVVRAARLIALLDPTLNLRRMMWMALIHDFAEHLIPDYTPRDQISKADKYRREYAAFEEIVELLGPSSRFIQNLWIEFEENLTPEARWVRQLDALDATVKACHYERLGYDVSDFFDSIVPRVTHPKLIEILGQLMLRRNDPSVNYREFYFERLSRPTAFRHTRSSSGTP